MTRNNDYRTPKDRISSELRELLEKEDPRPVGSFYVQRNAKEACSCNKRGMERQQERFCKEERFPLAMIYSPKQEFENLFEPEAALEHGSLFCDLVFPFKAYCCGGVR